MKKIIISVFMVILVVITSSCSTNEEPKKVGTIPLCNVRGKSYFTNNPNEYVDEIDENYDYYGTINVLEEDNSTKDLSTNYKEYVDKEIYVYEDDDTFIYIKYKNNKYQKLYYETESRNK